MRVAVSPGTLTHDTALLLARLGLAAIYIQSGFGKIFGISGLSQTLAGIGFPLPPLMAVLTVVVELGCGLAVLLGFRTRLAALALIGFTLVASYLFHDFWTFGPPERQMQTLQFMKNMGLIGGFLALIATGPGRFSLDGRRS